MSLADSLKSLNEFDINDLDINNAGIWPTPIKAIVALIVFGLILGGGYWFFIKDQYAQLDRVAQQEQELKQKYERSLSFKQLICLLSVFYVREFLIHSVYNAAS